MEQELLSWEAPEYEHRQHGTDWFWTVGVIGVGICITAIIVGNVLFGILIILGTIALLLQAIKHPRQISFGINRKGIRIGTTLYPYATLDVFWVTDTNILLIRSQKSLMPLLIIPIEGISREEVRDTLLEFLHEEELREPISHRIMESLGF
jgi:hypothetical protein